MQSRGRLTLAELRDRAGLTQRDVARVFRKREATISDWERRAAYPTLKFSEILQLTILYRCTLEELSIAVDNVSQLEADAIVQRRLDLD